jgi:hypothetical protein
MASDAQFMTYTVSSLPSGCWFVEGTSGTSGYSFQSLADAERFAIALAKRNPPSKVRVLSAGGEMIDEKVFHRTSDSGS